MKYIGVTTLAPGNLRSLSKVPETLLTAGRATHMDPEDLGGWWQYSIASLVSYCIVSFERAASGPVFPDPTPPRATRAILESGIETFS